MHAPVLSHRLTVHILCCVVNWLCLSNFIKENDDDDDDDDDANDAGLIIKITHFYSTGVHGLKCILFPLCRFY